MGLKVSGFTFIKNGLTLGYPIKESIESIEPLCDEIIVNVGYDDFKLQKDDGTYQYLTSHFKGPKFKFLKSFWDPEKTSQGLILSEQTNIALQECQGNICQYIQGDEVIHEDDYVAIKGGYKLMENNPMVQGLVFDYMHFYGDVDLYKHTRSVYRREVRTIRNGLGIKSWLDAQGFRHQNDSKLRCSRIKARIFHYGWARQETVMKRKVLAMDKLYHGKDFEAEKGFEYQRVWGLKQFKNSHPQVMAEWIKQHRNSLDILHLKPKLTLHHLSLAISDFIEAKTDYRIGEYRNYRLI